MFIREQNWYNQTYFICVPLPNITVFPHTKSNFKVIIRQMTVNIQLPVLQNSGTQFQPQDSVVICWAKQTIEACRTDRQHARGSIWNYCRLAWWPFLQSDLKGCGWLAGKQYADINLLWGRRLGPGPYDRSKAPFSLPTLSCSPAAFSVGNSSGEKDNSRLEALEPVEEIRAQLR